MTFQTVEEAEDVAILRPDPFFYIYLTLSPQIRSFLYSSLHILHAVGKDGIQNHKTYIPYTGEIPDNVAELFDLATRVVRSGKLMLDMEEQLALYGLFKAATAGHCVGSRPSSLNFEARAKWDAWNECRGIERDEAMFAYVQLLERIVPEDVLTEARTALSKSGAAPEEEEEESVFMTEAEYELHRQKIKERSGAMGSVFSTEIGGSGLSEAPSTSISTESTDVLSRIVRLLQTDDVAGLRTLLRDVGGENLLDQQVAVQSPLVSGKDPILLLAVDSGAKNVVRVLVEEFKAPVNTRGADGLTPLHMAIYVGDADIALTLTKAGADATKEDESGETALELYDSLHSDEKENLSECLVLWAAQLVSKQANEKIDEASEVDEVENNKIEVEDDHETQAVELIE